MTYLKGLTDLMTDLMKMRRDKKQFEKKRCGENRSARRRKIFQRIFFCVFVLALLCTPEMGTESGTVYAAPIPAQKPTIPNSNQNSTSNSNQNSAAPKPADAAPSAGISSRLMSSWEKLTSTLTDTLNLRDKQETLPESSFLGADKTSNAKKINALLEQAIEILLQSEANDLRKQAIALRAEIPAQQVELYNLRNKAISAPESSKMPWVQTRAAIEERAAALETEIREKEQTLADINGKVAQTLRQMGVNLDDRQIDILMTSVTGDDLFQNTVVFASVKQVVEKLGELSQGDRGNLEIGRRYSGMYLVLNDVLMVTQEELIKKIDGEYKPRLAGVRSEAENLRREALASASQSQYSEAQKNTFKANAEANAMTVRVAGLYAELLESQRKSIVTTLASLKNARDVAEHTYRTIRSTGDLRNLIQSGLDLFDSIQGLTMPQIQPFEYEVIRKEFEEINKRLRSE